MDEKSYVTKGACDQHTKSMLDSQSAMLEKLESIEKRLFKDNGRVSMQTRIDRHEQVLRLLLWGLGIVGGTLLAGMAGGVALLVRGVLMQGAGI